MSKALNVQDRGGFFDDPFFRDSWSDFDSAVQRVLDRFDAPALQMHHDGGRREESAEAYRSLRSARGAEEDIYASQALQVTERDGRFQVVMDVRDFNPRNLQVRAVEDNRIVVEGKYQQVSPDGVSSAWKTFSKEFTLPDEADIDLVTTALSKDGVLTIRAPRKATNVPASGPKPKSSTVQSINESYNEQRTPEGVSTKSFKSTSSSMASSFKTTGVKGLQSSSSFESCDSGLDSLPRDIRDRLMVNESGLSSVSSSNSSCSSPVPSEAASDISRVSTTMEFDIGNNIRNNSNNANNNSVQRSEVTFNVEAPGTDGIVQSPTGRSQATSERVQSPGLDSTVSSSSRYSGGSNKLDSYPPANVMPVFMPSTPRVPTFTAGCGSSGDTNVTIEEKNGKRTVTSERNNTIQERDGVLESREIAAEIDEKDGQSARREAVTRIQRKHDDPDGRFKEAEKAEATDVSESCIKHLPDGSTMKVKKSSTSSSSQKSFSSTGGAINAFDDPFFSVGFPNDFGDLRSLMGRGHSLMSQMSTDSMASTLSGRSDRSHITDRSSASTRSNASDNSHFSNRGNASDQSSHSSRASSAFSDRSRASDGGRHIDAVDSMRDRFGFSDRHSTFPERSLFSNRPSLAERFPNFSDAMADFDDFPQMDFPDFPSIGSSFSRSSRNSNNSFSSSSSFDPFDGKF